MMQLTVLPPLDMPARLAPSGANAGGRTLTRASTDTEAVAGWLAKYADSPATLSSYQKEGERLLMWCSSRGQGLAELAVEDMHGYRGFLRAPPATWCLQPIPRWLSDGSQDPAWRQVRREPRNLGDRSSNPAWRPFVGGLGASAVKQAVVIVFGLFEYLCATGYLAANPLRAARRKHPAPAPDVERYLPAEAWRGLLAQVEALPRDTLRQSAQHARTRFALHFLYLTGLRRSEFAAARTSDLRQKRGQWWLEVVGKGNKQAPVPLPTGAVEALKTYRESMGLTPWPGVGEDSPLLRDLAGKRPVGAGALHQMLVAVFKSSPDPAVRAATTHWLRHTAATHQLDAGVPLLTVRDNLRHSSVSTTERYLHADRDKQHQATELHKI